MVSGIQIKHEATPKKVNYSLPKVKNVVSKIDNKG